MVRTLVAMGSLRAFPCLFVHCLEQRAFLLGQLLGAAHWPQTPSQPCQTTNGQMVWAIPTSLNKSNSKGIIGIEFVFPRSTKKVDFGVKVVHAKVWGFTPKFGGSRMFHACFTHPPWPVEHVPNCYAKMHSSLSAPFPRFWWHCVLTNMVKCTGCDNPAFRHSKFIFKTQLRFPWLQFSRYD